MERRRREIIASREAAGENVWTSQLDDGLRGKLVHYALAACKEDQVVYQVLDEEVKRHIQLTTGLLVPPNIRKAFVGGSQEIALSYIDAVGTSLRHLAETPGPYHGPFDLMPQLWDEIVPILLNSHRVSFRYVDGEIFPLASEELHAEVVLPALELLHGRPDLQGAKDAYREAISQIQAGKPSNAITDAGAALQETLRALGCNGNALGEQIKDAKRKGLLAPHDGTLASGIEKFLHWSSADRSETGDAHWATGAVPEDAWLMVHIVGALIVRLAGPPRAAAVTS